ncbi:b84bcc19-db81-43b7-821d-9a28e2ed84d2 [Thermothielavioides terrestris]|uniref:B84bcc19-db81-43b7-821d-9a28e2ed84d2 n=1 Tax=Thermothielavioides terrestris TaxID=2587410 RepID=A0A3S4BEY6_9PEZI|nr:b84bcc19-db81-43b7-821d-9a28e2ed84d2 [Thermothielavioides terrestris]
MLTPVRDMLALFTAVTNPKDEPEDECLWARFWLSKAAFRLPQILPGLDVRHDAFIQRAPFHRAFLARLLLRMVYKLCRAVCIYKLLGAGNKRIRRAWRG